MNSSSLSVTYTPGDAASGVSPDLLMLEQKEWKPYSGALTRASLARYIKGRLYGGVSDDSVVDCGWGKKMIITVYAYLLRSDVRFRLVSTVGELVQVKWKIITEKETVSFDMEKEATLKHPAKRIVSTKWLAGPYTSGGLKVEKADLSVDSLSLQNSVPLFGSVLIAYEVDRAEADITISQDEALPLLASGWSEFCVGLPVGGKPVALEIAPPPGAEELAKNGQPCGRGSGSVSIDSPEEEEPVAPKADKHLTGDYCTLVMEEE